MTATACTTILAGTIAAPFTAELAERAATASPSLVAFLANDDPAAATYATYTAQACAAVGIRFDLRRIADREDLEDAIIDANNDAGVHGILVYYPVFGGTQDAYVRNVVHADKDVEGLGQRALYNLYHNIRYLDAQRTLKSVLPCTPLAIVKTLEHVGVYNRVLPYGDRLHGRVVAVVNRSEVVGRPLAAMLANDGARVYSVDVDSVHLLTRGTGLKWQRHRVEETALTMAQVLPLCDVVISGVPGETFKIPAALLKDGVVAVNFASAKNFDAAATKAKAAIYVPAVGKVTVAMLQRNLLQLAAAAASLSSP